VMGQRKRGDMEKERERKKRGSGDKQEGGRERGEKRSCGRCED